MRRKGAGEGQGKETRLGEEEKVKRYWEGERDRGKEGRRRKEVWGRGRRQRVGMEEEGSKCGTG